MLKAANRLRTPAPNNAQRLQRSPDSRSRSLTDSAYPGNRALLRQLSRSGPIVRRDPPADAKKTAPAAPAAGPAPSPTPDAAQTDEVKLTIPWDQILKGDTTLLQVLMPGLQPAAPGAGASAPAPAGTASPAPAAPKAGSSTPPPSAPAPAPAPPALDAPSRLSLKDFGNLSLGLRLGFPDMKMTDPYDAAPSALQQSIQAGELINYSMTGKLPTAYQLDKGKLVGACWGIFSKYIAPDFAAKIAKGMSGKTAGGGISYELDGVLLPDFSGGGVSFTLKFGGSSKKPAPASAAPGPVQPKLKVGSTTDPLEAEADRAADQVMRMPASSSSSEGIIQRKCAACEEEDKVHTKNNGTAQAEGTAPPIVSEALSSPGQVLDTNTRAFFEKRFDADFSQVRIHNDSLAAQSADAINSRAYATGNHIVLGAGETSSPTHLLAHELAHVVQNGAAPAKETVRRGPQDVAEMDAKLKAALEGASTDGWMVLATNGLIGLTVATNLAKAATVLNGYSPDDMLKRLAPLSAAQRASIHEAALIVLGPDSRVAQLTDPSFQNTADAHFYTQDNFDDRFEGVVDPTSKTVTLLFRVKFEFMDGIRFGATSPGAPGWEEETKAGKRKFKEDFKSVVESTWSGKGVVHPKCPLAGVNQLKTKVVVTVVESGQHTTFKVTNLGTIRSAVSHNQGQLDVGDNAPQTRTSQVSDPTGKIPIQTTTTQIASTHEFGHAIGLPHVHCASGDDPCYGVTEEERRDVMGAGNVVQVVQRNGVVKHDDFVPFERIAKRWGKDAAGSQANCNEWSAV